MQLGDSLTGAGGTASTESMNPESMNPILRKLAPLRASLSTPSTRKVLTIAALAVSLVAFLTMWISLRGAYNLDGADATYGDSCGSSPPSYQLLSGYVDQQEMSMIRAAGYNNASTANPAAGKNNQADGESCASGR